jgi:hypothetical protein
MRADSPAVDRTFLDELYEDLFLMVQFFEEETRERNQYLVFMPYQRGAAPEDERDNLRVMILKHSMLPTYALLVASAFLFTLPNLLPRLFSRPHSLWIASVIPEHDSSGEIRRILWAHAHCLCKRHHI